MTVRAIAVLMFLAGVTAGSATAQTQPPMAAIGGEADAQGCLASTGSTWSTLKKACIRMWDVGVKLMPLKPQGSATYAAYVVFASGRDGHRAELFLYDRKGSLILEKTGAFWSHTWQGEGYSLTRHDGVWSLSDAQGTLMYQSPAS